MTPLNTDELRAIAEAAPRGPWLYRPKEYDDWGLVRGGEPTEYGPGIICQARDPNVWDEAELAKHRAAKTDPWEAPARHIATYDPPTILALLDRIAALEAERAKPRADDALREALTPSAATKAAYMGEFYWIDDFEYEGVCQGRKVFVPWTTIKEIMAAIRARATLEHGELGKCPHGSTGPCSVCGDEG